MKGKELDFHFMGKKKKLSFETRSSFCEVGPRDSWHIQDITATLERNEYKYIQKNLFLHD